MVMSIDLNTGGSSSFQFDQHGDSVTGKIVNLEELQQTDLQTGELKTFDNGQPMMMYRVELQTQLRDDPDDDGVRSVYLKGSKKTESMSSLSAVLAAVKAATGRYNLTVGGTLTLTYVGDGQARNRGFNPPKQYQAQYQPPSVNLADEQPVQQYVQQPAQVAASIVPPTPQPSPAQPPAQAAQVAVSGAPTDAQIAALRAAGIDPASVFPGFAG